MLNHGSRTELEFIAEGEPVIAVNVVARRVVSLS
jgi:hypothetical protein